MFPRLKKINNFIGSLKGSLLATHHFQKKKLQQKLHKVQICKLIILFLLAKNLSLHKYSLTKQHQIPLSLFLTWSCSTAYLRMDTKPISAQLFLLLSLQSLPIQLTEWNRKTTEVQKNLTSCGVSYELLTTEGQPHLTSTFFHYLSE